MYLCNYVDLHLPPPACHSFQLCASCLVDSWHCNYVSAVCTIIALILSDDTAEGDETEAQPGGVDSNSAQGK